MNRLIYYTYSVPPGGMPAADAWRLLHSVTSLRAHNRTIPIRLFVFGALPGDLDQRLADLGVDIEPVGDYAAHLAAFCPPRARDAFARYPFLHKWTCLDRLAAASTEQLLYLDSDTYFFGDVAALFDEYGEHDVYAREEPFSNHSDLGRRPEHLDEEAFAALARSLGLARVAPFNTGVVLLNHGIGRRLAACLKEWLGYVWRFAVWLAGHPEPDEAVDILYLREHQARLITEDDRARALPYPSRNGWIKDQVALWLTLGMLPGLRWGRFSPVHVLQGREFAEARKDHARLVHYFSVNTETFRSWLAITAGRAPLLESPQALHAGEYFERLGRRVEDAWRACHYDEEQFPAIAEQALTELPPGAQLGGYDALVWMLTARTLPPQLYLDVPFGQPAVQVYVTPRWHIEVLHWIDGTTSIHEHGFNGAFHVLAGSSIHCRYRFHEERRYNARLRKGRIERLELERLRPGATRRILAGGAMSHSLFHLDRPSVTVVIRTRQIPGAAPQYTYLRPCLALDPFDEPEHLLRQKQGFAMLAEIAHPDLGALLAHAYREAEPAALVQLALATAHSFSDPSHLRAALEAARARHGELVDALHEVLAEQERQRRIVRLRAQVHAPEHRFLLALLCHFDTAAPILALVRDDRPGHAPEDTILAWISELTSLADPRDPARPVFDFTLDEVMLDVARAALGGRPFEAVLERLAETYDAADLVTQRASLEMIHRALGASSIFGPLFR
ncbi:MAG TPA: hypothetical protein VH877_34155 [Polyangia bacterium]|jgi:hypothetical protein|nr:hypothetical protein [Polyangia bacterium]